MKAAPVSCRLKKKSGAGAWSGSFDPQSIRLFCPVFGKYKQADSLCLWNF